MSFVYKLQTLPQTPPGPITSNNKNELFLSTIEYDARIVTRHSHRMGAYRSDIYASPTILRYRHLSTIEDTTSPRRTPADASRDRPTAESTYFVYNHSCLEPCQAE